MGVALWDDEARVSLPLETVPAHPKREATRRILSLAREYQVLEIVVGLPRHLSGAEGESARDARIFAEHLVRRLRGVRVCLLDERLTTKQAHDRLKDAGIPSQERKVMVDQVAAQIILDQAVETEKRSGKPPGETLVLDMLEGRKGGHEA